MTAWTSPATRWLPSIEVVTAYLERIATVNPAINAMVTVLSEQALAAPQADDEVVRAGGELGARYWHVGPMARSVRDIAIALQILAGPDNVDGCTCHVPLDLHDVKGLADMRIGYLVGPGFGPIRDDVGATVLAAADMLQGEGCTVEPAPLKSWKRSTVSLSALSCTPPRPSHSSRESQRDVKPNCTR